MTTTPRQLADDLLTVILDANPIIATMFGIRDRDERLPDPSEPGEAAYQHGLEAVLAAAGGIDPAGLGEADRVTLAVVRELAGGERDQLAVQALEYTVTDSFVAPAIGLLTLLARTGITEPAQADGYLARLAGLPEFLARMTERHRAGLAAGRLPVGRLAAAMAGYLERYLADPEADPLRRPQPGEDADGFRAERDRLLAGQVYPALARYREVIDGELAPAGRPDDRPGLCWLAGGEDYYATLVRAHTTTDRSPAELHQTGLDLIAQLRQEYAPVGARLFGTSDVGAILERLRADPALRWRDGQELLAAARAAITRADRAAPDWFGRLPVQQCVVAPIPDAEAPGAPAAYYLLPALDGSRPGTYFANTYQAGERGRATAEATAFHEAVPGHHFQFALAQELTGLPLLRRMVPITAYGEGWGLYAERLADEMGLYSGDLARLGMLSLDSLRAARLVVDTGLHAHGWSREQVVDYLKANTASPLVEIESETDRYISAPGQALAYMVGRMEIQRIRAEAAAALADRFDLRAFHDTVLGSGALPLTVLAEQVRGWVRSTGGQPAGQPAAG